MIEVLLTLILVALVFISFTLYALLKMLKFITQIMRWGRAAAVVKNAKPGPKTYITAGLVARQVFKRFT